MEKSNSSLFHGHLRFDLNERKVKRKRERKERNRHKKRNKERLARQEQQSKLRVSWFGFKRER